MEDSRETINIQRWNVPLEIADAECCATCKHYYFNTGGDAGGFFSPEPYSGCSECDWREESVSPWNVCGSWKRNERLNNGHQQH